MKIGFVFCLALISFGVSAQTKTEKRYPVGERTLVVSVPAGWVDEVKEVRPGTSTISWSTGPGKPVQVLVTPYTPGPGLPPLTKELVRENTSRDIEGIKAQAVEKEIPIVEFKGKGGLGYYFEATDKAPKPGEFKYLRQGTLMVGDNRLLVFTILTNSRQEPVIRDAMQMLQGAVVAPR